MGFSNHLISILNFFTALLSLPILAAGIWLASKYPSVCLRFFQWPLIFIGLFILLVSIAGFVGSSCRIVCLLWLYLVVMFLLILVLLAVTVFAFVVTNKGAGEIVSGKGYREYRLGNYSIWLQKEVEKSSNWDKIRSCLSDAKVCSSLNNQYPNASSFSNASLSPLQSGCCKPPSVCQFTFTTATSWTNAQNPNADSDCKTWSNNSTQLCFNCNSCRAGVLENVKKYWRKVSIIAVVMLALIIAVYTVGCSAFRNIEYDK